MSETMTQRVHGSAESLLAAIDALVPEVSARAVETEAARRLPPDLVALLASSGCFGMLLPRSHGGVEGTLADHLRGEALARADGSVGWTVMIGSSAWADMVHLPRASFDELFAEPGTIVAGAISPSGTAEAVGSDAFRISGRWGLVTGVEHATWVGLNCLYDDQAGGPPGMRLAVAAAASRSWSRTPGRSAGSAAPAASTSGPTGSRCRPRGPATPMAGEPCIDARDRAGAGARRWWPCRVSRVALGIAAGALDDILGIADRQGPAPGSRHARDQPRRSTHDLAAADARLRSARALHDETVGAVWAAAVVRGRRSRTSSGRGPGSTRPGRSSRQSSVVEFAYRAGGGSALYDSSPLQRRLRDVHAVTQHFIVRPDVFAAAGSVLAGQEPPGPVF